MCHHKGLIAWVLPVTCLRQSAFMPQGLSNAVWSVAKLGAEVNGEVNELLGALAAEAVSQLADEESRAKFIPQNLSNM